jgi:hypothetical protein
LSLILNLIANAEAAQAVGIGLDGAWQVTAVVKLAYTWDQSGKLTQVQASPVLSLDEFSVEAASSGLLRARELGPLKPKVDVLLAGALAFPSPITQTDVEIAVGERLLKRARVFGDRVWLPGMVSELVPSDPRPVGRIPIAWERSYGGSDPADAEYVEPRNPAGSGVARDPKGLHGRPVPNFEESDKAIGSIIGTPTPIGFGPIAAPWQQRIAFTGTYDEAWAKTRRPLLPEDFSTAFFNVAPVDQRLDGYQPEEEVRLLNMSASGGDRFCLPSVYIPVAFVTADEFAETQAEVDTLTIEPEERQLTLLAKAQAALPSGPQSLGRIVIGEMSNAIRESVETGGGPPAEARIAVSR